MANTLLTITEDVAGDISFSGMYEPFSGGITDDEAVLAAVSGFRAMSTHTGVLPPVVRWISPNRRAVLLERSPMLTTIRFHGRPKSDVDKVAEQLHDVMLPWMAYAITVDHMNRPIGIYMFAIEGPLTGGDNRLYDIPLTNIYEDGRFCLPSVNYGVEPWDLGRGIAAAFDVIWSSSYNMDLTYMVERAYGSTRPTQIFEYISTKTSGNMRVSAANVLKAWSELTAEGEHDVRDFNWNPARYGTVNDIITQMMSEDAGTLSAPYMLTSLRTVVERQ